MRSSLRILAAPLRVSRVASLPASAPLRCACACSSRPFSVFSSSSPSDSLSQLLRDKTLLHSNNAEQLDRSVPLGAPKPSALNKLRQSGRPGREGQDGQRMDAASLAMRKAMDYKIAKQQAKEKAEAEAAKKAQEEKDKKQA